MADQKDGRSQNQPSHDAQVKSGQHSHGGERHASRKNFLQRKNLLIRVECEFVSGSPLESQ